MTPRTSVAALVVMAALAAPSVVGAQDRRGTRRAVPRRTPPPIVQPRNVQPRVVRVLPSRPYYYRPYYTPYYSSYYGPYYGPGLGMGLYSGGMWGYHPYAYGAPGYAYGGYRGVPIRPYGGVRLDLPQRHAEVYVDGYLVGTVDDFDGVFQQLHLEAGPHRIEIRAPGFEQIAFDVKATPGRTITYRETMRKQP